MSLLQFRQVRLHYPSAQGPLPVLNTLDLSIRSGEFVTFVGPSGCGKSSLLALVAGTQLPTQGEILFDGDKVQAPSSDRGIMFQNSTLFPWLNVIENIAFGLKLRGIGKKERLEKARKFLERVELADFAQHYPYELSGGMKQRTALARTLINGPKLVLMDEPCGALDAFTKSKMQELLSRIWKETEQTFLLVTHDVAEAIKLGTRIIVLSPRPATILKDILIDPADKQKENFQDSPQFKQIANEIYTVLSDESA